MYPYTGIQKNVPSIEITNFESEFIAVKRASECVRGLRYKLGIFGIPADGTAFSFGDNQLVLCNIPMLVSTLKKKAQNIANPFMREGCASDECRTNYVHTSLNFSDLMTDSLSGEKR